MARPHPSIGRFRVMRVLNAYAGIGGNRHLWPEDWEVTAVELDARIAAEYARRYPSDVVLVEDAHAHVVDRAAEYDAVWTSPPCPSHSRLAKVNASRWGKELAPDPRLMLEVGHLRALGGRYVVENVHSYYRPLILPDLVTDRHYYWMSSAPVMMPTIDRVSIGTWKASQSAAALAAAYGLPPLELGSVPNRTRAMRNAVLPIEGLTVATAAFLEPPLVRTSPISGLPDD